MKARYFVLLLLLVSFFSKASDIKFDINLRDFDPQKGDVTARTDIVLPDSLLAEDGIIKKMVTIVDESSVDESVLHLPSGKRFAYFDSYLNSTYEVDDPGNVYLYPFDKHRFKIKLKAFETVNGSSLVSENTSYLCRSCIMPGFSVIVSTDNDSLDVTIKRNLSVIIITLLLSAIFFILSVTVLVMSYRILKRKEKPDIGVMGFAGGLLFAFPVMRSIEPSAPPPGVLMDYFGLFIGEFFVTVSLLIIIFCWHKYDEMDNEKISQ
ncbi:DUF4436 family protein [Klebsiella michiganensis]|jgi:hypothetical protein|uniref:DUF4436 family protein n=1 Tax=Klebsiella michiganensis TaxID=1134687 RepID=UPI00257101DE|nr:DUF4436 family protein [Klebsiella michiganensis]MDL4454802.1 DUF4436 family protein [Klebsiella michiganensis]